MADYFSMSISNSVLINNCKVSDPFTIANEFNEFFTSVAQKIAEESPLISPLTYFPAPPMILVSISKLNH